MAHVVHHVGFLIRQRIGCLACARMAAVACVGIAARLMIGPITNMRRHQLAPAVVATINNPLADGVQRDLCFVVVHGRAAGHVVHVGVLNAGQAQKLPVDAGCAQCRDQLANFDGACFHRASLMDEVSAPPPRL